MQRRAFIHQSAALGCSLAASPLLTPVAIADAPWQNRLVVIILRGAMDGLDAIRPIGDPDFAALRSAALGDDPIDLDGFWALHPALSPLMPLWSAAEFGAVHAVSTPYRDKRSHFDGQDLLEAGGMSLDGRIKDGWLNRLLQTVPGMSSEVAYAIGRDQMAILSGAAPAARWSPEARLQLTPQAQRLLEVVYHNDPLFRDAAAQAIEIASQIKGSAQVDEAMTDMMAADPSMSQVSARGTHLDIAQFAAARLRGKARVASFSINGWDTHQNQRQGIARALGQLSDTILTLRAGLGALWQQTGVLCMTEFGRTARENGTRGTDHGTGGAMFYAGGALRGGQVITQWPGLTEADLYDRRDLMPTRDVRSIASWVMHGLMNVDRTDLENAIFPGLDLGNDPGIFL